MAGTEQCLIDAARRWGAHHQRQDPHLARPAPHPHPGPTAGELAGIAITEPYGGSRVTETPTPPPPATATATATAA